MVSKRPRVLLVAGGVSVFEVVSVEGDYAIVESIDKDAPGCYQFPAPVATLVPIDPE
ncbi:hypothetical protein [Nocardia sp. XZ_19_369]|uniref:hypothetical protein n=1 Tax=Nocardia sp. XZ_19_369 TaxID=2769487 RepID=UPI00188EC700|nr:hypothetical protein [Nocardia sp. XZ_19_369]